jgi:2-oxoacid:acceptor oxidoreductase delta subunit (pyruvate/2-ketoisovalerate family)
MKSGSEAPAATDQPIVFHSLADMPRLPVSLGPTLSNKTGSWRYIRPQYEDKTPPCNHACPAGSDVVRYIGALCDRDPEAAWRIVMADNPLPGVCSRVCPHPCEAECNRAELGGAIAIHALERHLADEAMAHGWRPGRTGVQRLEKVAVVGAGPAGLSCAYHLALLGYAPTVFEAENDAGGLLRYGIPIYRLPRQMLDFEIAGFESLGVRFVLNARLGDRLHWPQLQTMDAVFLALGQGLSRPLGTKGEETRGVLGGLEFLRRLAGGRPIQLGRRVIVVGGGNTAMDAARCAIRQGAEVTVLYRRTERQMPAIAGEVEEARAEGVRFHLLAAPIEVLAAGGQVAGLRCVKMSLGEADESGRERPVPIPGSQFDLPADTVIVATGQELDAGPLEESQIRLHDGRIVAGEGGATSVGGVFAGGDAATAEGTVAQAVGSGRRVALAIDRYLGSSKASGSHPLGRAMSSAVVRDGDLNLDHVEIIPRPALAQRSPEVRRNDYAEVSPGLPAEAALREAERCISCGTCTACDTCLIFCPDVAIARLQADGYTIAYDYCKGCGICAEECPRAAMSMEEEMQ